MKNQKKIHKITTKLYNVYKLIYKTESCGCKVGQKRQQYFVNGESGKFEIKLSLPFMVSDLAYKFQTIYLGGNQVIEHKPNEELSNGKHGLNLMLPIPKKERQTIQAYTTFG